MINKIKQLTKIFLLDYYQQINLIDKKTNKINKKSMIVWLAGILILTLTYISFKIITFLMKIGQPILFLKIYLPIIATVIIFQLILLICNIFYYSKDLKDILPFPIKPIEILISKLNTITIIMYATEAIFLLIPLIMYGVLVQKTISFFICTVLTIILFPIIYILSNSFIMMILMKLTKFIKNRNIFQILVTTVLIFLVNYILIGNINNIIFEEIDSNLTNIQVIEEKTNKINDLYIVINSIINMLTSNDLLEVFENFGKISGVNIVLAIFFIEIGKNMYFKNILKNINNIEKGKKNINKKIKYKMKNKKIEYLKNDIRSIIRNSTFFIQNIIQYICIIIIFVFLVNIFLPMIMQELQGENIAEKIDIEEFKIEISLIVAFIMQLIFSFSNLSITAISREGKNAIFMKYIPIPLDTQITLKVIPQITMNIFVILIMLSVIYLNIIKINIIYYLNIFILSMLFNFINSYLTILIDLKKPNLNWTNEESVAKDNENKVYQYMITLILFFILSYCAKLFKGAKYGSSIMIINIVFLVIFIILKIYIKKNINKLFEKIY